ncbi:MAG TPA: hypothetical protein VN374_00805 [Desulfitobacteriaceae bacterium]|nr:hypothetical protein [Desulfitobacteriaceae bacterium]
MKISRDYILGLGSGLVISALIMFAMQMSGIGLAAKSESSPNAGLTASVQKQNTDLATNTEANSISNDVLETGTDANSSQDSTNNKVSSDNSANNNPVKSQSTRFTVAYGATAVTVAGQLEKEGLISDKQEFLEALNKRNAASKLQTGTFNLPPGLSVNDLISILIQKPN